MAKKKPSRKNTAGKKKRTSQRRRLAKKKSSAKKERVHPKKHVPRGKEEKISPLVIGEGHRVSSAGQAGDTQGLSRKQEYDSESVRELVEEGQYFEAEALSGVEDAKEPDQQEVITREVPEDDVPEEYRERD